MKRVLTISAWVAGLCMAGAEGHIAINFIGLSVFLFSSMVIIKEAKVPNAGQKKRSVYGTRKD